MFLKNRAFSIIFITCFVLGRVAYSEENTKVENRKKHQTQINKTKNEEKTYSSLRREKQIVKLYDSNWQFGVNRYWFKERENSSGNKARLYPYTNRYLRGKDEIENSISPLSNHYTYGKNVFNSSLTSNRKNLNTNIYGLTELKNTYDTITTFMMSNDISFVEKSVPKIEIPKYDFNIKLLNLDFEKEGNFIKVERNPINEYIPNSRYIFSRYSFSSRENYGLKSFFLNSEGKDYFSQDVKIDNIQIVMKDIDIHGKNKNGDFSIEYLKNNDTKIISKDISFINEDKKEYSNDIDNSVYNQNKNVIMEYSQGDNILRNVNINILGTNSNTKDKRAILMNNNYTKVPLKLILDKDSAINFFSEYANGIGSYDIASNINDTTNTPIFINKGNIIFKEESFRNVFYTGLNSSFINDGNIVVDGKENVVMLAPQLKLKFVNNGKFILKGEGNIGILSQSSSSDEIINDRTFILNNPIEILGTNNIGIYSLGVKPLKTTDDSNIQLVVGGNKNIGFSIQNKSNSFVLKEIDMKINSINGIDNKAYVYAGGKVEAGGTLNIEGGSQNIALYGSSAPKNLINTINGNFDINIKNSPSSVGIYVYNSSEVINKGKINIDGENVIGIVAQTPGTSKPIQMLGELNFNGYSKLGVGNGQAIGLLSTFSGKILSTGKSNITVSGENSAGVLSQTSQIDKSKKIFENSDVTIANSNITATSKAVNIAALGLKYEDKNYGSSVNIGENVVLNTKNGGLTFYTEDDGNISLNNPVVVNIEGGKDLEEKSTLIQYNNDILQSFNKENFTKWSEKNFKNTLTNLTVNFKEGSRFINADKIDLKLSDTSNEGLNKITGVTINGENFKSFLLKNSVLTIDVPEDLDNQDTLLKRIEFGSNNKIINNSLVTGKNFKQYFVINKNLENGKIQLEGKDSIGMYNPKQVLENLGSISVKDESAGMYSYYEDILNKETGKIKVGKNSTGIYYSIKEDELKVNPKIINNGEIISNDFNSFGIYVESSLSDVAVMNNNKIKLTGSSSIGMIVQDGKNGKISNTGDIEIGNSSDLGSAGVGICTNSKENLIENNGNIKIGDNNIGILGFNINSNNGSILIDGENGVGIYSEGNLVNLENGSIETKTQGKGIYLNGKNQTLKLNLDKLVLKNKSYGVLNIPKLDLDHSGNKIVSNIPKVELKNSSVYIFSEDLKGNIENRSNLVATGNDNIGITGKGNIKNEGNMDFSNGVGNIAILATGNIKNTGNLIVGNSDIKREKYGVGMSTVTNSTETKLINKGKITVVGNEGIGMYGSGKEKLLINDGVIDLQGNKSIGMYLTNGAEAWNNGVIKSGNNNLTGVVGVVLNKGSILHNTGEININSADGIGVNLFGGIIDNTGIFKVTGTNSTEINHPSDTSKESENIEINIDDKNYSDVIKVGDKIIKPTNVKVIDIDELSTKEVVANSIGMYVNTSGINYTKPIENIGYLTSKADIIIGSEIANQNDNTAIEITDPKIIEVYNESIKKNPQVEEWGVYSGSLTWMATVVLNEENSAINKIYLVKKDYSSFAKDYRSYVLMRGLDQLYPKAKIGSKTKELFNKLNGIGNNEIVLLAQAIDEMKGYQYSNTQRRIYTNNNILDKELSWIDDWNNPTKDNNKVKLFKVNGDFKTNKAGVLDYDYSGYGMVFLHENETSRLGQSDGWYAGFIDNKYKFKDIGHSNEKTLQGKVGIFKKLPFDMDNRLNLELNGEVFLGHNKMKRRYLVVDQIFDTNAKYNTYGVGAGAKLRKNIYKGENLAFVPYTGLKFEYGKFEDIDEKQGAIKLKVKSNDYFSVKPEIGMKVKYKKDMSINTSIDTSLDLNYQYQLGIVDRKNKVTVEDTNSGYYSLPKGNNSKGELNLGFTLNIDYKNYGIMGSIQYDVVTKSTNGSVGFKVKF